MLNSFWGARMWRQDYVNTASTYYSYLILRIWRYISIFTFKSAIYFWLTSLACKLMKFYLLSETPNFLNFHKKSFYIYVLLICRLRKKMDNFILIMFSLDDLACLLDLGLLKPHRRRDDRFQSLSR